jgi:calmodulin
MSTQFGLTDDELEEIREIFSHYDRNGNGVIDRSELGSLFRALDEDMSDEEIEAGMQAIDDNGNGQVEFEEFLAWWASD